MTLDILGNCSRVAGSKQVKKALSEGRVRKVFLASDADPSVTAPIRRLCSEKSIELIEAYGMAELGKAARLEVKTAAVAVMD